MEKTIVPYANLRRFYDRYKTKIDGAIQECLDNSYYISGPKVSAFEEKLSQYIGQPSVGVSSGTSALLLAYETIQQDPDSRVAVPSFTFISTPEMLSKLKHNIVWLDCNMDDYTIDIADLEKKMSKNVKAVVGVDIFGHTCDYDKIKEICGDIPVIQDGSQSFGGSYKNKKNGSYNLTTHSFYPAKNLFCLGDGGAVSGPADIIEKIKMNKDHGRIEKYIHNTLGWNERLDSIQANVLYHLIDDIDLYNDERKKIAKIYNQEIKIDTKVKTAEYCDNVYNQYTIRVKNRDKFIEQAKKIGIQCGVMWPLGCHQQPVYSSKVVLKNTEEVANTIVSLPCWPFMLESEVNYVVKNINQLLKSFVH
jgi:UDP-2-acetamido-2-deoxy-ribo-hexuluronate aminotransferase